MSQCPGTLRRFCYEVMRLARIARDENTTLQRRSDAVDDAMRVGRMAAGCQALNKDISQGMPWERAQELGVYHYTKAEMEEIQGVRKMRKMRKLGMSRRSLRIVTSVRT